MPIEISFGGMGNRTPDIQLAKLTLYQLSYTPLWGTKPPIKKTLGGREILRRTKPSSL